MGARFDHLKISGIPVEKEIYYVRDGEGNVIAEYDGLGNLVAEYVYGNNQRIAKINPDGAIYYYLNDHPAGAGQVPGSARTMVGAGWSANYYPFGDIASQTGSNEDTHFDFTGQERDRGTGLIYFGARYLDPGIERFLTVDPRACKYPSLNPYNYVSNNPIIRIDLNGESWYYVTDTDSTGHWEFVNDDKNELVITSGKIVNQNTNEDGQINWENVSNTEGSTIYNMADFFDGDNDSYYFVVTAMGQYGYKAVGFEGGGIFVLGSRGDFYEYGYGAVGVGPGFGGVVGIEVGALQNSDPTSLGGWFYGSSGFAAAVGGASFSVTFSGFFNNPMFTVGGGAGAGAGITIIQVGRIFYIRTKKYW